MRQDILNREQDILLWIKNNESKSFICKELKCKPETLERYLKKLNINYIGNRGAKGKKIGIGYVCALDYLNNDYISSHKLKIKLIKDGIKDHKCEVCERTMWMGIKIPLELDHIDGNHFNNELINIRILCPNCHAQTLTNSGRNINKCSHIPTAEEIR